VTFHGNRRARRVKLKMLPSIKLKEGEINGVPETEAKAKNRIG
jgi:hypothetical protein